MMAIARAVVTRRQRRAAVGGWRNTGQLLNKTLSKIARSSLPFFLNLGSRDDGGSPSLALARKNVGYAGLLDRIELREQPGEELPDERAFDLAWIPAPFVPRHALGRLVEQVHRALKPGGWLLFAAAKPGEDSRGAALRFRVALYGGASSTQQEIEKLLAEKGLTEVKTLPGPPRDFKIIVAGRRASA